MAEFEKAYLQGKKQLMSKNKPSTMPNVYFLLENEIKSVLNKSGLDKDVDFSLCNIIID